MAPVLHVMTQLVEMLRIRCTRAVKIDFKVYAAKFDTYNAALEALLEDSEKVDVLRKSKIK